MKKSLLCLLLLCIGTGAARAQLSAAYAARLQTVFDSVCNRYHIKGASAAVLVPGAGTWKGVYGESYAGQPITPDMQFGIGSNTKTYVAALMLKLQEDGLLNINDTIGHWIQNQPNISGQITIKQLLNHTSGLYNYTSNPDFGDSVNADYTRVWQPEEVLQFVKAPLFAPGAGWSYCNTNYLLAGLIIKAAMNQPFEVTLRNKILLPQQLAHTVFFPHEAATAPVPHAWYFDGVGLIDAVADFGYDNTAVFSMAYTAGAILSTAEDNAMFWRALISGQIITPASFSLMQQWTALNTSTAYGLGIFRYRNFDGHTIYEHGGTNVGYINENLADSVTGVCISVLTNQDSIDNNTLLGSVVRALHQVSLNPPTAIASIIPSGSIRVWPNPAADYIQVAADGTGSPLQCRLYDAAGRQVLSESITAYGARIGLSEVPAGSYTLLLSDASGRQQSQRVQVVK